MAKISQQDFWDSKFKCVRRDIDISGSPERTLSRKCNLENITKADYDLFGGIP